MLYFHLTQTARRVIGSVILLSLSLFVIAISHQSIFSPQKLIAASSAEIHFGQADRYVAGYRPNFSTLGDFDKDGALDIALPNWYSRSIQIFRGTGTGKFLAPTLYGELDDSFSLETGDFNGDGWLDLVSANRGFNTISLFLNNGAGILQRVAAYSVGSLPQDVAVGDINGDSKMDVVVSNLGDNSVTVFQGVGNGTLQYLNSYAVGSGPFRVELANATGDQHLDIVAANYSGNSASILSGNGRGVFAPATLYSAGSAPRKVAVGSFNTDTLPDMAVVNHGSHTVTVLLGGNRGSFLEAVTYVVGQGPNSVDTADMNGDGFADLVVTNGYDNTVGVLLGNGDGTFDDMVRFATDNNPASVAIGDLNGDLKLDMVVSNFNSNTLTVYLNGLSASPTPTVPIPLTPTPSPSDTLPPIGHQLQINNDAVTTTSRNVTLRLLASNPNGSASDLQMSFSNDGIVWSKWLSYSTTSMWELADTFGVQAVYGRVRDRAGAVSAVVSDTIEVDTSVQTEYGVSINDGALFTNQVDVILNLSARPHTASIQVSNDGGFAGAEWEPYVSRKAWAITRYGNYVVSRTVFVRYRDVQGNVFNVVDEILLDVTPPQGWVRKEQGQEARADGIRLELGAVDDISGVVAMRLGATPAFSGAAWQPFNPHITWSEVSAASIYAQFRDGAGNLSAVYATSYSLFMPMQQRSHG